MAISSASTIDEILAEYVDTLDYPGLTGAAGIAMARAHIKACRVLLVKMPKGTTQDRGGVQLNPELLPAEIKAAEQYIAGTPDTTAADGTLGGGSGGVKHFSFENLRGDGEAVCGGNC